MAAPVSNTSAGRPTTAHADSTGNANGHWEGHPVGPTDGVDALPSAGPQGDALVAQANSQANEMWAMNAVLMRIQHEQAKQKLVVEAASAISKNAADVGEFLLNKI